MLFPSLELAQPFFVPLGSAVVAFVWIAAYLRVDTPAGRRLRTVAACAAVWQVVEAATIAAGLTA